MIRIKTEQEFIEEFGENWRHTSGDRCVFTFGMNKLLGTSLPKEQIEDLLLYGRTVVSDYRITTNYITNKPLPKEKAFTKENLRKLHDMVSNAYMLNKNLNESLDIIQHLNDECED